MRERAVGDRLGPHIVYLEHLPDVHAVPLVALAVVGGKNDHGAAELSGFHQILQEPANLVIGPREGGPRLHRAVAEDVLGWVEER